MILFKEAAALSQYLHQQRIAGKTVGFVPTMGALHAGHLSLIRQSKQESDLTVCSIFVNPTQFNNASDFQHYPVTIEKDMELLLTENCDILFLPPVSEIYPPSHVKEQFDLGTLETVLEGAFRPGHFQGVCEVVNRLLQIVEPHRLFMGQKDYQQCMVIRRLLELTGRKELELRIGSTQRDGDGLALSSRNLRLNAEERQQAPALFKALSYIKNNQSKADLAKLTKEAAAQLEAEGFVVDYITVCNALTLQPLQSEAEPKIALVAATINNIRLIDNLPFN